MRALLTVAALPVSICALLRGTPQQAAARACEARGSQQWLATRPSPLDSVSLSIAQHVAKMCYSRPHARGRSIDSLVPRGLAWRTGANEPTTLFLTGPLIVGGVPLSAGRFVLLTVPGDKEWKIAFYTSPETEPAKVYRTMRSVGIGTGPVTPLAAAVEQFTIRADMASPAFVLEWGNRSVRVPVLFSR